MPKYKTANSNNNPIDVDNRDLFLKLSKLLTGVEELDQGLAKEYYHQYLQQKFGVDLDELMGIYREIAAISKPLGELIERIKDNSQLLHVAKQIVRIWYISQFKESSDPAVDTQIYAGHWKDGILWDIIKAHAPAYSDGPHGYWANPPEGTSGKRD